MENTRIGPMEVLAMLSDAGSKTVILDTDTYNEVDDQFALAYLLLNPERVHLVSVNAAPFYGLGNRNSVSARDGMEKSYEEIGRVMDMCGRRVPYYKGSVSFITEAGGPVDSPAAQNIIRTVRESGERVYVAAIGAITNVASALLLAPDIADNMTVVWLAGNGYLTMNGVEFNMWQDPEASRAMLSSRAPLVQLPCRDVVDRLNTTVPELEKWIGGKNPLGTYLTDIVRAMITDEMAKSKVIWDVSAAAALMLPEAIEFCPRPRPRLDDRGAYIVERDAPQLLAAEWLDRDAIFCDLFQTLLRAPQ